MKLRVPVSPLWTSTFTALGAVPVSMNFAGLHAALQAHDVDAQENSLAIIETAKLYEVQGYCSLTNHMWDGYWLLANEQAMARLSPRDRAIVEKEFTRAVIDERDDLTKLSPALCIDLATAGMQFNTVETDSFQAMLAKSGYYKE